MVIRSLPLLVASSTAFFLLGGLLVWMVVRLLRSNREQLLASGPITAEQEFALREAAALLLLIEVPRFGSRFRELEFEGRTGIRADDEANLRFPTRPGCGLRRDHDACSVRPRHCRTARLVSRASRWTTRGRRLLTMPDHVLAPVSRTYGLADHWHRDLRDRHVVKPAPRLVAGSSPATGMNRIKPE